MKENIWRYVAIAALSALGGLMSGQFIPNRNIVTSDQLGPLTAAIAAQTVEVNDLRDEVNQMRGELQAQKLVSGRQ